MKVYRDIDQFDPIRKAFVTTGTFDGVHLGHKVILNKIIDQAKKEGGESVLLTFSPHPRLVLFPDDNNLRLLTTLDEKIKLLEESGLDHLIIHEFTTAFSRTTAYDFVRDLLVNKIGVYKLIIGYDHQFGRNREGSIDQLRELTEIFNFKIEEIPAKDIDTVKISSTKIREALLRGDIQTADKYLGYHYALQGKVIHGSKLGRQLGFKTANIHVDDIYKLIPGNGVFAVRVRLENRSFEGMMNIGRKPTIDTKNEGVSMEVHIFNFDEDIYTKDLNIQFYNRIRDEKKFDSLDALKAQLSKDKKNVISYFESTQ